MSKNLPRHLGQHSFSLTILFWQGSDGHRCLLHSVRLSWNTVGRKRTISVIWKHNQHFESVSSSPRPRIVFFLSQFQVINYLAIARNTFHFAKWLNPGMPFFTIRYDFMSKFTSYNKIKKTILDTARLSRLTLLVCHPPPSASSSSGVLFLGASLIS